MKFRKPSQRRHWRRHRNNASPSSTHITSSGKRPWYWWVSGIAFVVALTWAAYPIETAWDPIPIDDFEIGKPSPYTVISPTTINYEDLEASQKVLAEALSDVPPVYRLEVSRLADVQRMFEEIRKIRERSPLYDDEKIAQLQRSLLIGHLLSEDTLQRLVSLSDEQIDAAESHIQRILGDVLKRGVIRGGREADSDIPGFAEEVAQVMEPHGSLWEQTRKQLSEKLQREVSNAEVAEEMFVELQSSDKLQPGGKLHKVKELFTWNEAKVQIQKQAAVIQDPEVRSIVREIGRILIRPNVVEYDKKLTEERRLSVAQAVAPVRQKILKGQTVVGKGQLVTEQQLRALQTIRGYELLDGVRQRVMRRTAGGLALLLTLLTALVFFYLARYEAEMFREYRKLLTFCLVILLTTVSGKAVLLIGYAAKIPSSLSFDLVLLIPTAITAAIVTILFNPATAIVATAIVGVVIGFMGGLQASNGLFHLLLTFVGSFVVIFSLSQVRQRRDLTLAGLYVCAVNIFCIAGSSLISETPVTVALQNMGLGIFSGSLVALITPGLLPVFESISQITTDIKLLELSDLNHPLLKQLEQRAVGTYHHSMNVSKLAEAAAEAVGANELLARVGAYYHDIGKMNHPRYFTENQEGGPNPHDKLGPMRSAKIIADHVTNGIQMAREHKLPKVIEEMIPQHHGTSLISFFHLKALQNDKNTDFREEDFHYVGPKPQSREATIMMLADSVEAASRSLYSRVSHPTPKDIEDLIQQIINKKISEGQLDQSHLTLRDLQIIADTFERVLCGFYHSRIDYPKEAQLKSPMLKAVMTNGANKQRSDHPTG